MGRNLGKSGARIARGGLAVLGVLWFFSGGLWAQDKAGTPAPAPKDPTIEERVADLEALSNSTAPTVPATRKSNVSYSPGDNAWLLTSSALVLMMTGPALALFYGALVRTKNVLSPFVHSLSS